MSLHIFKKCRACGDTKTYSEFAIDRRNKDGRKSTCKPCFNSNRPSRRGCSKAKNNWRKYYDANRTKILSSQRENEDRKDYARKRYEANRGHIRSVQKKYESTPSAKARRACRQQNRKQLMKHARPPWLSKKHEVEIQEMYWLAQDLKLTSGEVYHVDHVIPLQGRNICGLHVPWNLQILPADLNIRKSNSMEYEL